jgi:hypothetical protein
VGVCGDRAAKRERICTSLLLADSPPDSVGLRSVCRINDAGPVRPRFNLDVSGRRAEPERAAHRGEVLGDIDNRYDDYRALAEEVDAWNVGGRVAAAFKLKQVIDKIL